jgi:hypothetical protein
MIMVTKYFIKNMSKDWRCTSEVEHLPSMHKALGSILSTGKKKKKKFKSQHLGS